jgi:sugar-phosphatase
VNERRRGLFLDFDGVLVDSEPVHFESWNEAFGQLYGVRLESGRIPHFGLTLEEVYQLWLKDSNIELTAEMKEQVLAHKTQLFYSIGAERLTPMPGSVELIRKVRSLGWYVAVVSRSRRLRLHGTLELMRIPTHFDLILGSEDAVDLHTDRKDYGRAASILGIDPADCVVIEDSATGVADALAAGIGRVIGLTTSLDAAVLVEAGAHQVVDHLDAVDIEA